MASNYLSAVLLFSLSVLIISDICDGYPHRGYNDDYEGYGGYGRPQRHRSYDYDYGRPERRGGGGQYGGSYGVSYRTKNGGGGGGGGFGGSYGGDSGGGGGGRKGIKYMSALDDDDDDDDDGGSKKKKKKNKKKNKKKLKKNQKYNDNNAYFGYDQDQNSFGFGGSNGWGD